MFFGLWKAARKFQKFTYDVSKELDIIFIYFDDI